MVLEMSDLHFREESLCPQQGGIGSAKLSICLSLLRFRFRRDGQERIADHPGFLMLS